MKTQSSVIDQIKDELNEDFSRYDYDWNDWSEIVLDYPSYELENLLDEIDEDEFDKIMEEVIKPYIEELNPENRSELS